jgi:hypothetical protein
MLGPLEDVEHFPCPRIDHIPAQHDTGLEFDITLGRCEGVFDLAATSEVEPIVLS